MCVVVYVLWLFQTTASPESIIYVYKLLVYEALSCKLLVYEASV
jgi:hypothetical protein